jgi:rhomboid protease GluP
MELHVEQLSLYKLKPATYIRLAADAARSLGWRIRSVAANAIAYQTQEPLAEQVVVLEADDEEAKLTIYPLDEYYNNFSITEHNATQIRTVMQRLAEQHYYKYRNLHPMDRPKWGALVPSATHIVTPLLVYINVLLFAITGTAQLLNGGAPGSLVAWGGNFLPAVQAGEVWRLFTYMFLHANLAHIGGNVFALLYVGLYLEPLIGKLRFASAYLFTGICAALLSVAVHPHGMGIGASGAIFGLYGVFLSLLTTGLIEKTLRKTMLRSLLLFIVYNLVMGLEGNVDNAAHIGGLISGFLIGRMYYGGLAKDAPIAKQWPAVLAVGVSVLALAWLSMRFLL